jgi:hypothetical protein
MIILRHELVLRRSLAWQAQPQIVSPAGLCQETETVADLGERSVFVVEESTILE